VIVAALAVLFGGCAKNVNANSAEALVTSGFESNSHLKVKDASCPDNVPVKVGATFQCTAKTNKRGRYLVTVAIEDDKGKLRVIDLKPATRVQIQNG
jgi:hypothetical protein